MKTTTSEYHFCRGHAMTKTTSVYTFWELLQGEGFSHQRLELMRCILNEILRYTDRFHPNTAELVQLAGAHSQSFRCLDARTQESVASILTMPVFFMVNPSDI